ncbi:type I polyketide synthase [Aureimonas sp. ME7]|uniref:type I polyketide synthase n=1 Tax=Aureimonas sp. ME7 TaxID=2744252 RepID=UPI0015F761CD|nr:type I polyketide synthase [Aureimonas sp. ME7]
MSGSSDEASGSDIAIVGMAMRVPGARNVGEFWANLVGGVESIRDLTAEERNAAADAGDRVDDPRYVARAAELPDMEIFDAEFFGMSPKEAAIMDPQHRQFLQCAWEAMEDAGRMPDATSGPVGVFGGCGMGSYFYANVCGNRKLLDEVGLFLLRHTGNDKDFLTTRASFLFDLRGPSVNVQTACSTSLVAVHMACQSLLAGECETALAGGVTIELPHRHGYLHQEGEILSPDGRCRPFDHRAGGTVFGSGTGVVVLRRLSDALADGDPVHAVIKATAVNNDGSNKAGYLAPGVGGQSEAVIEALGLAGIAADTIGYVECHGTGTYLGDPIEVEALTQAFRQSTDATGFCRIGSVKSNIGHLDTAAGVVGLIKAALCVRHGVIPPTLGFERANPAIPFETGPFRVADALISWPAGRGPRRAGVNSLGVGGTNAHAIVEAPPSAAKAPAYAAPEGPALLVLSARTRTGLDEAERRLADALSERPELTLADTAHTLLTGRKRFEQRRVVVAGSRAHAIASLRGEAPRLAFDQEAVAEAGEPAFLFPGGGAQHVGMARSLIASDAGFRATVEEGLAALEPQVAAEIRSVWMAECDDRAAGETAFLRPSLQLPAILIVEVAVARWWMARGVRPAVLMGHSMGENAAACVSGVLTLSDAVRLVRLRGELFETAEAGGMLSVAMSREALLEILPDALDLASQNAPELCVVSGRNEDLERFAQTLEARGQEARRVPIDIAAHSRMLDALLPRFEAFLRTLRLSRPAIPIVSNLTGGWLSVEDATDPLYWVRHLRSTVEFGKGMALLAKRRGRILIEVGPGRVLSSLAKLQPGVAAAQVINSLPRGDDPADDAQHLLGALGRAFLADLAVPVAALPGAAGGRRVSLPTYPFARQRYFIERVKPSAATEEDAPLRRLPDMAGWGWRPGWRRSAPGLTLGKSDASERGAVLVFLDRQGFVAPLVSALRASGRRVVTVGVGDLFARHAPDRYSLRPADGRAGYEALVSALKSSGGIPETVLHLWLVTSGGEDDPRRVRQEGFFSLLHLTQAAGDAVPASWSIQVVANRLQRIGEEAGLQPEKALVLGPAQVLPKEMPGLSIRVLDIDPVLMEIRARHASAAEPNAAIYRQLIEELDADPASEIVAYRGAHRWTRIVEPLALPPVDREADLPIRQGGVYLVTGGLGDLGLSLARSLCERYGARLVLVGRSPLPPREDWAAERRVRARSDRVRRAIERIEALEAEGYELHIAQADVADFDAMNEIVADARRKFGRIDGVFHAAGLVDDGLAATKGDEAFEAVLSPKVDGTRVLDRIFGGAPLDLFVLFSSTSTDTAPVGQADYVAANAYLNAYADAARGRPGRRTLALHWGVWNEIGLAARAMPAGRADPAASADPVPAKGPFFRSWVEDESGASWAETVLSPRTDWVLNEHRMVSGQAVMPGTGYVEILAQLMAECGFSRALAIEDLTFLQPLLVGDDEIVTLRAGLQPDGKGYRALIQAKRSDVFETFAQARFVPVRQTAAPERLSLDAIRLACGATERADEGEALRSVQDGRIGFGPRWQVLRSVAMGQGQAIADLALDERFVGDAAQMHPALLDIATGFAMGLEPSFAPGDVLWAPMSYGRVAIHAPLGSSVTSIVTLSPDRLGDGFASFSVVLCDPDGRVLARIERFVMRRLDSDVAFAARRPEPVRAVSVRPSSPETQRLEAQVRQGILPAEGFELLRRALASGEAQPILSSLDLPTLQRQAAGGAMGMGSSGDTDGMRFERPDLDSAFVPPRTELETTIAGFWSELLGIERIGVDDNFFDIGGHSLIAVRLFRMIRKRFGVDLPISVLYEAPTIAGCAALIGEVPVADDDGGKARAGEGPDPARRPTHLVAMGAQAGANGTPLFLCAGMFGNVLNLRELALHLATERPVYGLQARGLLEGDSPQETFEEMAETCLAEIRAVQPHGPYLLGGFSGGGITAYEMARRLRAAGEEVALVVMLDTPLPGAMSLDLADRLHMKLQDLRRDGRSFMRRWREDRANWREHLRTTRQARDGEAGEASLRSARIETAFRAALPRYTVQPYEGRVALLRPRLEVLYRLRGGRRLQAGRNAALDDNGWSPFVADLTIREVPGDHDGMVLEPFVRILADRLRPLLRDADRQGPKANVLLAAE